jgi:hypothetical protein
MTDNYVKFISEQVHKEKVRGFTDVTIAENVEFESEEFDSIVEAVIDALAEDIQDLQELSPELKARYVKKAGSQLFKAAYRAAKDAPMDDRGRTSRNTPVSTKDYRIKDHKNVKTIDKREAGINRAAKHGGHMTKMVGDGVKYAGFEAGHDIHTQRRRKVAKHIDDARFEIKKAVAGTKPKD